MSAIARAADTTRALLGIADLTGVRMRSQPKEHGTTDGLLHRALGARQLTQSVVVPLTGWRMLGAAVDALHLASMLPIAALSRRHRRGALAQIGLAALLIAAAVVDPDPA